MRVEQITLRALFCPFFGPLRQNGEYSKRILAFIERKLSTVRGRTKPVRYEQNLFSHNRIDLTD
jgi:hypothetical protein